MGEPLIYTGYHYDFKSMPLVKYLDCENAMICRSGGVGGKKYSIEYDSLTHASIEVAKKLKGERTYDPDDLPF